MTFCCGDDRHSSVLTTVTEVKNKLLNNNRKTDKKVKYHIYYNNVTYRHYVSEDGGYQKNTIMIGFWIIVRFKCEAGRDSTQNPKKRLKIFKEKKVTVL